MTRACHLQMEAETSSYFHEKAFPSKKIEPKAFIGQVSSLFNTCFHTYINLKNPSRRP